MRRLVLDVLDDAATCGIFADVDFVLEEPAPGIQSYRLTVGPGRVWWSDRVWTGSGDEAHLLVWLAEAVQELTMERSQRDQVVWPMCLSHQLGGHARVEAGVAVWWCSVGHAIASVGQL
jgi:hypothetical protein